jgi:surfactin synthase thioesterase subunit
MSQALAPDIEVLAIQYPGRQDRYSEPVWEDLHALADRIAAELAGQVNRPTALFGHSMGAVVAFEVARRLQQQDIVPLGLIVSGRRAPSRQRPDRVHLGGDAALIDEVRRLTGTGTAVLADPTLLRLILPALRGDYRAVETYRHRPGPPLTCPVVALAGDADPLADLDEIAAWAAHTEAAFRMRVFPGGHFFLLAHAAAVRQEVSNCIRSALEAVS